MMKNIRSKRDIRSKTAFGSKELGNNSKEHSRSKTARGCKDLCGSKKIRKNEESESTEDKDITFIVLQKNVRSMDSCGRIEEMICDLEGYRWDAVLLNEIWRPSKSGIWETHHKHIFMRERKYDNKHGVGILLNKNWRQRIVDAITTMIMVNHKRIKLMSVYFLQKTIEKHTNSSKKSIQIVGGDFNAKLGPGYGVERAGVGPHTHSMKETKEEIA